MKPVKMTVSIGSMAGLPQVKFDSQLCGLSGVWGNGAVFIYMSSMQYPWQLERPD